MRAIFFYPGRCMDIQLGIIPILIHEFTAIYESSIAEEDANGESDYREIRFNLARVLLELYDEEATKANINRPFGKLVQETEPTEAGVIFYVVARST